MEEDIKILEERVITLKRHIKNYEESNCKTNIYQQLIKECQALENLIKGYRELEKENMYLKEYIWKAPNLNEMTAVAYRNIQEDAYIRGRAEEQQKAEQIIYEHYIPKSKVKEKIEEYKKKIEAKPYDKPIIEIYIRVLQKLMEEK